MRGFTAACMLFLVVVLLGCRSEVAQQVPQEPAGPVPLSSFDPQVDDLLAEMTLDEKVGQMTQPDQEYIEDISDVRTYFLGSVLSGGSSDPKEGNSREAWADLNDRIQEQAAQTRLGIPVLYGVDAVHGHNNVLGAVVFPHNIGLGSTRNPDLVERVARATAVEIRATGINWTFAPCVTVPLDERWGRTYEGFSEEPELAGTLGEAAVRGFQGSDLSDPGAVLACAKHYLGDGGTTFGTGGPEGKFLDQGDTRVDEATLRRIHLAPYIPSIRAGVGTIMPSYSSWNGVKCSGSRELLTEILKEELGFDGFLISDYRAIDQVHPDYKTAIGISINAGMDMGMVPSKYREFIQNLKELVEEGTVPMSRIDDAVRRILRVKFAMGLMGERKDQKADRTLFSRLGSPEHRELGREAVRQSLVLLKNDESALPLAKTAARIHVAGKSADDLGNQCGGWTIDWQGKRGEVTPGGTTILQAIRQTVSAETEITFSMEGTGAEGADAAVLVIGETPYAEMMGDRADLSLDEEDMAAYRNLKKSGIPIVVVLLSGRPLIVNEVLEGSHAFVAAWLPGTEGLGVADVLFGDYKPTGKLSFTWPRSMDQIPINVGDADYDPLFAFGFGLSYE